jgi:tetratricopeptide (TPR) repeat protein
MTFRELHVRIMGLVSTYVLAAGMATGSEGPDLYPTVHVLIREAETAAAGIRPSPERDKSFRWIGSLYARAGYIGDARRAFGAQLRPAYQLWEAQVVYGDLAGAEKSFETISDAEERASVFNSLANLLWRMGQPEKARVRFETSRKIAAKISNPEHRKRILASIEQGLMYLAEEPPTPISATPKPAKRFNVEDTPIPLFPITTEEFADFDPGKVATRATANREFVERLYGRMAAGDREGLLRVTESAATPFQKALGLASIEHILILAGQPEAADVYARKIPDMEPGVALAKAEALKSAGAAWLRTGNSARAQADFEAALRLVESVKNLAYEKMAVTISIARAQGKGDMTASCRATLILATKMAQQVPKRPEFLTGRLRHGVTAVPHYRDEAFGMVLDAAIAVRDWGAAREIGENWKQFNIKAESNMVRVWLHAGRTDEALVLARQIIDGPERVMELLYIAQELLDLAGAPAL